MHDKRFDAWARALGALADRRAAAGALAAGALGVLGLGAGPGADAKKNKKKCKKPKVKCGKTCVDPRNDRANCGSCGNSCGNGVCDDGVCECSSGTLCPNPTRCVSECCGDADCPANASCGTSGLCLCDAGAYRCFGGSEPTCCNIGVVCDNGACAGACPQGASRFDGGAEICGGATGLCVCGTSIDGVTACVSVADQVLTACEDDADCTVVLGVVGLCEEDALGQRVCTPPCA